MTKDTKRNKIINANHQRIIMPLSFLFWGALISAGCAHNEAPGKAFSERTVQASSTSEKRGDLVHAVEDLRVALAADPGNDEIRSELDRLIEKRDREAERHLKAGLSLRDSDQKEARKEFLTALKIRDDYPEAAAALRELQMESAVSSIDARVKMEAKVAERLRARAEAEDDEGGETSGEEYSLDVAISSFDRGDFDTAIREFSKMKARYPNDPDIQAYLDRSCYNSGIGWYNRKNYNKALSLFNRVPKGFDHVNDYISKCRAAIKSASRGK